MHFQSCLQNECFNLRCKCWGTMGIFLVAVLQFQTRVIMASRTWQRRALNVTSVNRRINDAIMMPKMTTLGLHEYLDYNLEKSFEMRRIYTVVENRSKKSHHIAKGSEASWKPDKESQILKNNKTFLTYRTAIVMLVAVKRIYETFSNLFKQCSWCVNGDVKLETFTIPSFLWQRQLPIVLSWELFELDINNKVLQYRVNQQVLYTQNKPER